MTNDPDTPPPGYQGVHRPNRVTLLVTAYLAVLAALVAAVIILGLT